MPAPLTIRVNVLDRGWSVLGVDNMPSVKPESLQLVSNVWGSDTCSFQLKRDPNDVQPDLYAFTPCKVEIAGVLVWSGEIWETPAAESDEPVIQVQGRGLQYELDDDPFERAWVHTRLEDWKDVRSRPLADLTVYGEGGSVETGNGNIVIGWAQGTDIPASARVGVTLDLHQADAEVVVLNITAFNMTASQRLEIRGHDTDDGASALLGDQTQFGNPTSGRKATTPYTTHHRYITVFLQQTGAAETPAVDRKLQINSLRVVHALDYLDVATETFSELKADEVVKDALAFAPRLSQDFSLIEAATTSLPEYAPLEDRSPRDHIEAVNDALGWQPSILVDGRARFRPWPTRPKYRATGRAQFRDTSMNSGESIYNRAVVKAQLEDGTQLKVERYAGQQPGVAIERVSSPSFANPSFDTNNANWAVSLPSGTSTITRDTGVFDSSPASGKWAASGISAVALFAFLTGAVLRGVCYRVDLHYRAAVVGPITITLGADNDKATLVVTPAAINTWYPATIVWIPRDNYPGPTDCALSYLRTFNGDVWVDSHAVSVARPTIPDRRGFTRTKIINVGAALNQATMEGIGDAFLRDAMRTPLRGPMMVPIGGLKPYSGSEEIHPSRHLLDGGELVHLPRQTDPDTGDSGRDGRIASVTYDHATENAAVAIDETRESFQTVLASYGASEG